MTDEAAAGTKPESNDSGGRAEVFSLWFRAGGTLAMLMGAAGIVGTLREREYMPFALAMGLILMSAGCVLGGEAFSRGKTWGVPLVLVSCGVAAPATWGFSLIVLMGLIPIIMIALREKAVDNSLDSRARPAYGLLIGGLVLVLYWLLFKGPYSSTW